MVIPMMSRIRALLLSVLLVVLTACAQLPDDAYYQEPELISDQVATLNVWEFESYLVFTMSTVQVVEINGKQLKPKTGDVNLDPGVSQIGAIYRRTSLFPVSYYETFPILVEAGHRYQVRAGSEDNTVRIWVEETEIQEIVGMATIVQEDSD